MARLAFLSSGSPGSLESRRSREIESARRHCEWKSRDRFVEPVSARRNRVVEALGPRECVGCVRKCSGSSRVPGGEVRRGRHPPSESISCSAAPTSSSFRIQVRTSFHFPRGRSCVQGVRDHRVQERPRFLTPGNRTANVDTFEYCRLAWILASSIMAISQGYFRVRLRYVE